MTNIIGLVRRLQLQRLSSEMGEQRRAEADWQGGYDGMVELARECADALTSLQSQLALARRVAVEIHDKAMAVCNARHASQDDHAARSAYANALHEIAELAQPNPQGLRGETK